MTLISRDSFARSEIHREIVDKSINPYFDKLTCDWCGSSRKSGNLFKYLTETDGGSRHYHKGKFCSKSCHDSHNS